MLVFADTTASRYSYIGIVISYSKTTQSEITEFNVM
jgi:hypothetical protein